MEEHILITICARGGSKGVKGKNKVYWKVPLIYAFLAYTGSTLIKNQTTQYDLKTEYNNRYVNGSGSTNSKWEQFDSLGLVTQYTTFARKRDLSGCLVSSGI